MRLRVCIMVFALVLLSACKPGPVDDINDAIKSASVQGRATLIVFGAAHCDACKRMLPHVEHFRSDHSSRVEVMFIDILKRPEVVNPYGVDGIPMQLFYGTDGIQFNKHYGYYSVDDMQMVFTNHGIDLMHGDNE